MISSTVLPLLAIAFVLITSHGALAQDTTTEMMNATTTTKMPMMNPMKLGDKCNMNDDCKKFGMHVKCEMMKCSCMSGYKEDKSMMKCMPNAAVQMFVSVTCLALAIVTKFIL